MKKLTSPASRVTIFSARDTSILTVIAIFTALTSGIACGSGDSSTGAGGISASSAASSTGTPAGSSTGTGGMGMGGGGTGGESSLVNGCDETTAEEHTATQYNQVLFGGAQGDTYVPPCIVISVQGQVEFDGDFSIHPITGGRITNGMEIPDPTSPIQNPPAGAGGTLIDFPNAGTFPYYCAKHGLSGMKGTVFVK